MRSTTRRNDVRAFSLDFREECLQITAVRAVRLEALHAARMDPRFRGDHRILCNFLDARYIADGSACHHLGLTVSAYFRGQKIALVVGGRELQKLKEEIAIFNTGRVEMGVFENLTVAKRWLLSRPEAMAA